MTAELKVFGAAQRVKNPELVRRFLDELIDQPPKSGKDLEKKKHVFSATYQIGTIQNRDLVVTAKKDKVALPVKLEKILQKRSVRTISGVTPVGILTKPYPCPGRCVYCPTEDRMPKSYMSNQPAAARAVRNNFHPHKQVKNRVLSFQESGHPTSKLEVIVMGGTWSFLPHRYQSWYIKKCFDAANGADEVVRGLCSLPDGNSPLNEGEKNPNNCKTLAQAQSYNETAQNRIIGLTLETRPDFITERELVRMRRYGCTRIEIGVQTLDDDIQKLTKRGHGRKHVIKAMKLMKDFGFKVCWHLMPGLPGSNPERDLVWLREVFENPDMRPDFIKIYPCVVLETAELKGWWEEGRYEPYDDATLVKLLTQMQTFVPEYVRIMRLMRDIPVSNILDGAKFSNLRQILQEQPDKLREIVGNEFYERHNLRENSYVFRDIRAREVGFADLDKNPDLKNVEPVLVRRNYEASDGQEVFLSFEDPEQKHLFALLRLRKPSEVSVSFYTKALHNAALIREVHSYGSEISIDEEGQSLGQHRGLGRRLIEEAERIARDEWGMEKVSIIAGVGTREYYRKWGYKLCQTYMTKRF